MAFWNGTLQLTNPVYMRYTGAVIHIRIEIRDERYLKITYEIKRNSFLLYVCIYCMYPMYCQINQFQDLH